MPGPATGTEAGRSTDFNILVHLDRIGDLRLTPRYRPWLPARHDECGYVENPDTFQLPGGHQRGLLAGGVRDTSENRVMPARQLVSAQI